MSILRLEVGVQGSTEPTSLPFLGVARGPMVIWLSTKTPHEPVNVFGVFCCFYQYLGCNKTTILVRKGEDILRCKTYISSLVNTEMQE